MGAFDEALSVFGASGKSSGTVTTPADDSAWQIPPDVQRQRDQDRLRLLQGELSAETNPTNRAALQREIARTQQSAGVMSLSQPAKQSGGGFDDALAALDSAASQSANGKDKADQPAPSLLDKAIGAGEAALNLGSSVMSAVPGAIAGVSSILSNGKYGTQAGVDEAAKRFHDVSNEYTYQPRTQVGQEYSEIVGQAVNDSGIAGLGPMSELQALSRSSVPVREFVGNVTRSAVKEATGGKVAPQVATSAEPSTTSGQAGATASTVDTASRGALENNPSPTLGVGAAAGKPAAVGNDMAGPSLALSQAEQTKRAQVLNDIGLQEARRSAIAGDPKAAATDLQTAKLDGSAGNLMKAKFMEERQALENHADDIVRNTGGTIGTDQSALYGRGNTIIAPLDALKQWFDSRTSSLYKVADERSQGVPTQLDRFRTVLSDDSEMTNSDRVHLRDAVNAYAKKLGIVSDDGGVFSNGQQAETLRKYLGENWTPANGKFVAKLKDALDEDITEAAGEDVYGEARKMRALRGVTLDDPNGIAKIMDASGPEGINRAVPVEKIPDAVTGMPADQFGHIVRTLKNVPEELQPQAQAALAEIKAHFANKLADAGKSTKGQWNNKAVKNYLDNNAERMGQAFTPDELKAFQTLRAAGDILAVDQSYPGASVQEHNLLRSGMMAAVKGGATVAGTKIAGPVGGWAGAKIAGKIEDVATLNAAQKRMVPIRELLKGRK